MTNQTVIITPDQHQPVIIMPAEHAGLKERIKEALVKSGYVAEAVGEAAAEVALIAMVGGAFSDRK